MTGDDRVLNGPIAPRTAPELSRPFAIARIGNGTRIMVEATADECRALAGRMGLEAVLSLTCRFDLRCNENHTIEAAGVLHARVRQACVVSLEPFDADATENFAIRFVPEGMESDDLDLESDDEVTYEGGVLDLGEAVSEQLALVLDPFPRKPGAELPQGFSLGDSGLFGALAKLRSEH